MCIATQCMHIKTTLFHLFYEGIVRELHIYIAIRLELDNSVAKVLQMNLTMTDNCEISYFQYSKRRSIVIFRYQ